MEKSKNIVPPRLPNINTHLCPFLFVTYCPCLNASYPHQPGKQSYLLNHVSLSPTFVPSNLGLVSLPQLTFPLAEIFAGASSEMTRHTDLNWRGVNHLDDK